MPWNHALNELYSATGVPECWYVDWGYRADDLLLTYVTTSPRMFVSLDVLATDGDGNSLTIDCDVDQNITFDGGVLAQSIRERVGFSVAALEKPYYTGPKARKILRALEEELNRFEPWFTPARWEQKVIDRGEHWTQWSELDEDEESEPVPGGTTAAGFGRRP